jgi:5-methylcytosine-specific restriction endonuclease McrBC regulatory subunit McrC
MRRPAHGLSDGRPADALRAAKHGQDPRLLGVLRLPTVLAGRHSAATSAARRAVNRGLTRDYEPIQAELPAPRGKIMLQECVHCQSLLRNRVACNFDEFSVNQLLNRIVKASAVRLVNSQQITPAHRDALKAVATMFAPIDNIQLEPRLFRQIQFMAI